MIGGASKGSCIVGHRLYGQVEPSRLGYVHRRGGADHSPGRPPRSHISRCRRPLTITAADRQLIPVWAECQPCRSPSRPVCATLSPVRWLRCRFRPAHLPCARLLLCCALRVCARVGPSLAGVLCVHRVPRSSRSRYPTLGFRQAAATVTDARPALSSSSTPRPTRTGPTWSSMRES